MGKREVRSKAFRILKNGKHFGIVCKEIKSYEYFKEFCPFCRGYGIHATNCEVKDDI